jgi:hypothetical protein
VANTLIFTFVRLISERLKKNEKRQNLILLLLHGRLLLPNAVNLYPEVWRADCSEAEIHRITGVLTERRPGALHIKRLAN